MTIDSKNVRATLDKHILADGYEPVMDMEKSHGSWLVDERDGSEYLDMFSMFASGAVGYNHPDIQAGKDRLTAAALYKPTLSDIYNVQYAEFVEAFSNTAIPEYLPHAFFIEGGALGVENALKVAFDWKVRKNMEKGKGEKGGKIIHFKHAFHGRTGYTLSLTNTSDPRKTMYFPKFDWPRIHNPCIEYDLDGNISNDIAASESQAKKDLDAAFSKHGDRVAGIIIEPMQGEGGDNHFRSEFLQMLRDYSDNHDCLLIFDEIQTGFWGSGKPWMWQHHGIAPDIAAFGKKTQVCGIYANNRVKEVDNNVFTMSSRINSTWGGNLVDMVRSKRFIEIILQEDLGENILKRGAEFVTGLRAMAKEKGTFTNVRGVGSLSAFTLDTPEARDAMIGRMMENKLLALKSGPRSIRFRMPLIMSKDEVSDALRRVDSSL